jgi:hypothetical protein
VAFLEPEERTGRSMDDQPIGGTVTENHRSGNNPESTEDSAAGRFDWKPLTAAPVAVGGVVRVFGGEAGLAAASVCVALALIQGCAGLLAIRAKRRL